MSKKISTTTIVNEIIKVAGVSKENAINIFNLFGSAWKSDNIGILKALNTGIKVTRRPVSVKRKVKKVVKTATPIVKVKKKLKKVSGVKTVGNVTSGGKVKFKVKSKKIKKNKKLKVIPTITTSSSTTASV